MSELLLQLVGGDFPRVRVTCTAYGCKPSVRGATVFASLLISGFTAGVWIRADGGGGGVVGPFIVRGGEVFYTDTLGTHLLVEGSFLITAIIINSDLLVGANGGGCDEGDVGCMTRGRLVGSINEGAVCVTVGDKVCIGGEIWVRGAGGAVNDKGVMGSYSGGLHEVVILPGRNVVCGRNAHSSLWGQCIPQ